MTTATDIQKTDAAELTERYRLRSGVASVMLSDGQTRLVGPGHAETIGPLEPEDEAMLEHLAHEQ